MSQKEIILTLLRDNPSQWFHAFDLRGKEVSVKGKIYFLGHQGDRRARELAHEGLILRREDRKGFAEYSAKQPKSVTVYRVEGREVLQTKMF